MRSIRVYLVMMLLAFIALGNLAAALNGYRASLQTAERMLDKQLADKALLLSDLLASGEPNPHVLFASGTFYRAWNGERVLLRSGNSPDQAVTGLGLGYHFVNHEGRRWRVLLIQNAAGTNILVGEQYENYVMLIETLLLESILPIIWVIPFLLVLSGLVVYTGLRPLSRLAGQLRERRPTDFSPLSETDSPKELLVVVRSINQMLAKLDDAFGRERRFASDAAHELRTPLTALKLGLHNLMETVRESGSDVGREEVEAINGNLDRMAHTIDQLLALYRFTPGTLAPSMHACDINELIKNRIVELHPAFVERQQEISLIGEPLVININGFSILTLISNLLENAGKYTPIGGKIQVSLARHDDNAVLLVEDSGPGIPESDYKRVFDRFYRVAGDRHSSGVEGCGLGLSIVEHIVTLHNGCVRLYRSPTLGGLAVEIELPLGRHQKGIL